MTPKASSTQRQRGLLSALTSFLSSNPTKSVPTGRTRIPIGTRHPAHSWRQLPNLYEVTGIQYRRAEVAAFVTDLLLAIDEGRLFGSFILREPHNPHDANALMVMGWVDNPSTASKVGYVDRTTAEHLSRFGPSLPVSADLVRLFKSDQGKLYADIALLIPGKKDPFWSGSGSLEFESVFAQMLQAHRSS